MVQPKALNPRQREHLLDWIGEQKDPVTYDDLSERFGVHYQTARTWLLILEDEHLVEEHPIKLGNKRRFIRSQLQVEQKSSTQRGPMIITRGTEQMTFMDWAASNLNNTLISRVAYAMLYLYARSYFANSPDHQHLRGIKVPVEIRTLVLEWVDQAKRDLDVIKQMLSYKQPWLEGGELASRFGDLPVGIEMTEVIKAASFFHQQVTGAEPEAMMPSPAPPEPEPMTLGDTLSAMTPTGSTAVPVPDRVDEAAVHAEMQALEPLDAMRAEQQVHEGNTLGDLSQFDNLMQSNPGLHIVEDDES